jgi:hypothetical protein
MSNTDFENQVKNKLQSLDDNDLAMFAWVCAMRALPFLAKDGNFDYWINGRDGYIPNQRQNALHFIFISLITCKTDRLDCFDKNFVGVITGWIDKIVNEAKPSVTAYHVTSAIFWALRTITPPATDDAFMAAYCTIAAFNSVYNQYTSEGFQLYDKFQRILLEDIEGIKFNGRIANRETQIYGAIWNNFQVALKGEDCNCWWNWYRKIFENGFYYHADRANDILTSLDSAEAYNELGFDLCGGRPLASITGKYLEKENLL